MCLLYLIHRCSRRAATMLPWLVIPLIGLWALSHLLPPAFRFQITSPRLACVLVLLVTLFWYEILMPRLSAWRVTRNVRLRERKRFEALELHKLRKTATRRCRNCLTPYRDQSPGGGRFMCSYCGHISRRPVLDLPVPPGLAMSSSGKIFHGKAWSDHGWLCGQDWLENANFVSDNATVVFEEHHHCLAEKSYSGVFIFTCKLMLSFFSRLRWLWGKLFRISSPGNNNSSDVQHRRLLLKRGENGSHYPESRSEKARRKAEEKKQARLEKEQLEEEERKQREEVARLVEERRRLREEILETEYFCRKGYPPGREKDNKKEAEKKRQERRREKDKGSSINNSDVEELERKACKQNSDKKNENDRQEQHKFGTDSFKGQDMDMEHGTKNISPTNFSRVSAGNSLDSMRGTFLSSSKEFTGSTFCGKDGNTSATVMKEHKSNCQTVVHRKTLFPLERVAVKSSMNGDDKCINRPVLLEPQTNTAPKKSWQQLFTRSASGMSSSNANVITRPNAKSLSEAQSPSLSDNSSSVQSFINPINFEIPCPISLSNYPNGCTSSSLGFSPPIEPELFEDPCYIPDLISLIGPVSESLDNFHLDLGSGFATNIGLEGLRDLSNMCTSTEVHRPSPIESPISRSRVADEKFSSFNQVPTTLKDQDLHKHTARDVNVNDKGTWQMWNSSPLGHDCLGLVGSFLSPEIDISSKEDFVNGPPKTMASLFTNEDQVLSGTPQKVYLGNDQNGGMFSPVTSSREHDPWAQNAFYPSLLGSGNRFSVKPQEEATQNEMVYGSPTRSVINNPFEPPPADSCSKKELGVRGWEGIGSPWRPELGDVFPRSDVQSVWSI